MNTTRLRELCDAFDAGALRGEELRELVGLARLAADKIGPFVTSNDPVLIDIYAETARYIKYAREHFRVDSRVSDATLEKVYQDGRNRVGAHR